MKLVLDASAAIAVAVGPAKPLAIDDAEIVIAPTLFIAEVANGLCSEDAAILTFDNRLKKLCAEMGVPLAAA